jgi:hypothetical protein
MTQERDQAPAPVQKKSPPVPQARMTVAEAEAVRRVVVHGNMRAPRRGKRRMRWNAEESKEV